MEEFLIEKYATNSIYSIDLDRADILLIKVRLKVLGILRFSRAKRAKATDNSERGLKIPCNRFSLPFLVRSKHSL